MNPYALLPLSQRLQRAASAAGIDVRDKAAVDRWAKASGWTRSARGPRAARKV